MARLFLGGNHEIAGDINSIILNESKEVVHALGPAVFQLDGTGKSCVIEGARDKFFNRVF